MARHGFNGLALQEVADAVGITQAGLLHYIGNKDGLVELLMSDRYDRQGTPQDFLDSGDPAAVHPDGMSLPAYFRYLVAYNESRPQLMGLYMTLGVEATDPDHPAHDYLIRRPDQVWEHYSRFTWRLPPQVVEAGGWPTMRPLVEMVIEAMDGTQIRFFREPRVSLVEEWARWSRCCSPRPSGTTTAEGVRGAGEDHRGLPLLLGQGDDQRRAPRRRPPILIRSGIGAPAAQESRRP